MSLLIDNPLKNASRLLKPIAIMLLSLILLTGVTWYSTTRLEIRPPKGNRGIIQNLAASGPANDQLAIDSNNQGRIPIAPMATFAPFIDIVPEQDGTALLIRAGGVGEVGGTVMVNIGVGPGHIKGGHTMTFSPTTQIYIATVTGFSPEVGTGGPMSITTTTGLNTGDVEFNRAFVPASTSQAINSPDSLLQLNLISSNTITYNTYVAVVPSFAPPGPPPAGHRLVGSSYSVRAAGTLLVTSEPMSLRMYYDDINLAGADPHTLAIFAWDANPANPHWDNLGGTLSSARQYLSVATSRFTTYALMNVPAWHDDFDEFSGLDFTQFNNVTFGGTPGNRTLVLASTPGNGSTVSQPITPTTGFAGWDALTFTGVVTPPATTLSLDILRLNNSPVMTDVVSGASLAHLSPAEYPALKLRVNMNSTTSGQTPALARWQLSWQMANDEQRIYLPAVLK